jgi:hypothetical protein
MRLRAVDLILAGFVGGKLAETESVEPTVQQRSIKSNFLLLYNNLLRRIV